MKEIQSKVKTKTSLITSCDYYKNKNKKIDILVKKQYKPTDNKGET